MSIYDSMLKTMLQGLLNSQIPEDIGKIEIVKFEKQKRYLEGFLNLRGEEKAIGFNFNYDIYNQNNKYYFKIKNFFADRIWINNAVKIYMKKEGQELPSNAGKLVELLL